MKIGFDAKRAYQNFTGLGNYSRDLIEHLIKEYSDNEYFLFAPKDSENSRLDFLSNYDNTYSIFPTNKLNKTFKGLWRTINMEKSIIKNDVEIGANCAIDRATMGSTIIHEGVKLDNLIQVAHNVEIGGHTAIAGQAGIAGSSKVGKYVVVGGQVAISGHLTIADGAMIQGKSGIGGNIKEENSRWFGTPAIDYRNYLRSYAHFRNLPDMAQKMKFLEKEITLMVICSLFCFLEY